MQIGLADLGLSSPLMQLLYSVVSNGLDLSCFTACMNEAEERCACLQFLSMQRACS